VSCKTCLREIRQKKKHPQQASAVSRGDDDLADTSQARGLVSDLVIKAFHALGETNEQRRFQSLGLAVGTTVDLSQNQFLILQNYFRELVLFKGQLPNKGKEKEGDGKKRPVEDDPSNWVKFIKLTAPLSTDPTKIIAFDLTPLFEAKGESRKKTKRFAR